MDSLVKPGILAAIVVLVVTVVCVGVLGLDASFLFDWIGEQIVNLISSIIGFIGDLISGLWNLITPW